jgi:hypothetical protein
MSRKFTWNSWDFDCDGDAYIIAKAECPERENVPDYIVKADNLDPACKLGMVIEEVWCAFQVRSDWEDSDGPHGWYVVERREAFTKRLDGRRKPGWFPVWIIRKGEWY